MKILFIRPRPDPETIGLQHIMVCEPLELEYLCAAVADHSHETVIIDMILEKKPIEHFIKIHQPDVVAITAYITHVHTVKEYCRTVKTICPKCTTIAGGVHAEVVPLDFEDDSIDFVVRANGIQTFVLIIKELEQNTFIAQIKKILTDSPQANVKETSFNYPLPDRSKVEKYRSRYYYLFHNPCSLIKTSFGCPFDCVFCFCREITNGKYFLRTMDSVIDELKTIPEKDIYIVDDNFLVSRSRVLDFCKQLQDEKLDKKFLIYGRADFIAENEDVIKEFKNMGLRAVIVGLESHINSDLENYNKNNDVLTNEKAVEILRRHGVDCYATLILSLDWDKSDFINLYRWLKKLKVTFINLQPFTPLPGTGMYKKYDDRLTVPRTDYAKWDLAHLVLKPARMSTAGYYWQILKLYYRVSMSPGHLIKLLFKYSLHENIKMLKGSTRVSLQYLNKIFKSL